VSEYCCDDPEWILARIEKTKALIVKYEEAVDALSTGAQSYQLDTGQSRQLVQKAQLGDLQRTLSRLESRLGTYEARLGCGRAYGRPGW
jgi:hypothetical protein